MLVVTIAMAYIGCYTIMNEHVRQTLTNLFFSFVVVLSFTSGDVYDLSSDPDNSQTSVRKSLNTIFYCK